MKVITKIEATKLAIGLQKILLDMQKAGKDPMWPIPYFEQMIIDQHKVPRSEAEKVTEKVIDTGILRWDLTNNAFVL